MEQYALDEVDKVVAELQLREEKALLALPNVVGVGVGRRLVSGQDTGEPCLVVLVSRKVPGSELAPASRIPTRVEHCRTDVLEIGELHAGGLSHRNELAAQAPEGASGERLGRRLRPAQGGFSVSGSAGISGSIGACAVDEVATFGTPPRYYLLGSNSCLAGCNAGLAGDPVLQPSEADGGRDPQDRLARLARFVPLHFDGTLNTADAAIAEIDFGDVDSSVFWIGYPGPRSPRARIGQVLQKTGRGSCFSTGTVRAVNVTLDVKYPAGTARFRQQIVTSPLARACDNGSLAMDSERRPVGLVLACAALGSVLSPIGLIESLLQIRVGG